MSPPNEAARPIDVDTREGIMTITFDRPEKKNAFTVAMYEDIVAALERAAADSAVRCVLFRARGTTFTAGNDIYDFMNAPPAGEDSAVFRFLLALLDFEKPLVAAVHGAAVGVGVTMLLHVDFVYASDDARFTTPFVSLGVVPEAASSFLLPRLAGFARANEILLLGEPFDAQTALEIGLVARVVPAAELEAVVAERCQRIVERPAAALRASKKLIRDHVREQVRRAMSAEGDVFLQKLREPEAIEAFTAFFEKRRPDFTKL